MDYKIFDAHLDLTYDLIRSKSNDKNSLLDTEYLTSFETGKVATIVSAIYLDDDELVGDVFQKAVNHIDILKKEVGKSGNYSICTNSDDISECFRTGKIGLFMSLEGLEPIGNNLNKIDEFYSKGIRLMGLTWSRDNSVACGSHFQDSSFEHKGLTDFGLEVIKYIEKLPIILDVSHLNEKGFWDVANNYSKPFIASHSNCRTINDITRNLNDDQIAAIAKSGGVIGINGSNIIISSSDDFANISSYVDHIDNVVKIAGVDHVGFGFDLCNRIMQYVPKSFLNSVERVPKDVIKDHSEIPLIVDELVNRGYRDDEIDKITYGNFFRIIETILD